MPYRRYNRKMVRRPRRRMAKKPVRKVSTSVKKYVKRVISNQAENKYTVTRLVNQGIATAVATTPTAISLLPALSASANRHSRIGNQVRLKKGFISGRINLLPYNISTNPNGTPIGVKIWLMSSKQYNEIGAFSGTSAATAMFKSDTTPSGPVGNVLDLTSSIEDENFIVYGSKTFILGTSAATNNFPSTNVDAYTNNQFSAPFYFNWSKHFKTLKYNDTASSSICTNRNLWLVFQAVALDGRSVTTQPAEFHCTIENHFEDM